jgi:hypothetical protein
MTAEEKKPKGAEETNIAPAKKAAVKNADEKKTAA